MEKVTFEITPKLNPAKQDIVQLTKELNTNEYIQIAPNVYRFTSYFINLSEDIVSLYNAGCQMKTSNERMALDLFIKCLTLIDKHTSHKIKYEILINVALLVSQTNNNKEFVYDCYEKARHIYPDRTEPYYYCSIYCNKQKDYEKAYELLTNALLIQYDDAKLKYSETLVTSYGKYLYDELAVACYWLKKYDQAKILLEKIIDDKDFVQHKERLIRNLEFTMKELNK